MVRALYVHEINVPDPYALVEIDADGPVFLLTFKACATYLFGGPIDAIVGRSDEHHVVLRPTEAGSWYLASRSPSSGRYRFLLTDSSTEWVDFYLKVSGFG
jgi:hypothetical protein